MGEDDVRDVMTHPYVATASDGSAHRPGGGDKPHPRAYGTFPRKFRYALDDGLMPLEQAVRSCSGLPAEILGLPDRGTIRAGNVADLVVFDPKTFRDAATWDEPTRYATGVKYLFINGVAAVSEGKPEKARPGRALRLDRDGPAQTILKVGRIWTGDPANPRAEALAIRDGRARRGRLGRRGRAVPRPEDARHRPSVRLRHAGPDRRPRPSGEPRRRASRRSTCGASPASTRSPGG